MRGCPTTLPRISGGTCREHQDDPLPDGYIFDGVVYRDPFGDATELHPNFNTFAAQWIQAANAEIVARAKEVEAQESRDRVRFL